MPDPRLDTTHPAHPDFDPAYRAQCLEEGTDEENAIADQAQSQNNPFGELLAKADALSDAEFVSAYNALIIEIRHLQQGT